MKGRMVALVAVALVVGVLAGRETEPARATFPGANGKIASVRNVGGNEEIYTMLPDGSGQGNCSNHSADDTQPSWSPDGNLIAFVSDRVVANLDIWVMGGDCSKPQNRTMHNASDKTPAWSSDGTKIAFTTDRDANWEVYKMNADGTGGLMNLSQHPALDEDPEWSPNGSKIAFTTDRDTNREIYLMNADGTDQKNCTLNGADDRHPDWSPDGSKIAFTSDRDGLRDVLVINAADCTGMSAADATNLTNMAGSADESPAWSPDAALIAFDSTRDGADIWVLPVDNPTNQTKVKESSADGDTSPDWQPIPVGVGGMVELPDVTSPPLKGSASGGPGAGVLAGIAAGVAAGGVALSGAAWVAARRRCAR